MRIIGLVVFILLVASVLGLVYFKYQVPIKQSSELINVSISAELGDKKIATGYEIVGYEIIRGNTTEGGYNLLKINQNQIIKIRNINLEKQYFYQNTKELNITNENLRIDLELEEVKALQTEITDGNPINVRAYSEDYRNIMFCLSWSFNYIFVQSNYSEIQKPKGYENQGKCYQTEYSLKSSYLDIPVGFREFGIINEKDFINITFFTPEFQETKDVSVRIK